VHFKPVYTDVSATHFVVKGKGVLW